MTSLLLDRFVMTSKRGLSSVPAAMLVLTLAACGGGGGGDVDTTPRPPSTPSGGDEDNDGSGSSVGTYTELNATTSGVTSELVTVALNGNQTIAAQLMGTLNHGTGAVTGGGLSGQANGSRTEIDLDGTAARVIISNPASTEYVRFFQTSGTGADIFGVVGTPVDPADMPTVDSSTYNGFANVEGNVDGTPFEVTGDAQVTANWGTGRVTTLLEDFEGTVGSLTDQNIDGAITVSNSGISGTQFSGGTFSTTVDELDFSGSTGANLSGQFFGKNADEVGGVFAIDSGDLELSAIFAAE